MPPLEQILLIASGLLLLSIFASKISGRLGVPALLLFLTIGMLAGSDGPGGIYFDNALAAQSLGVVALAFILFSGGLDTDVKRIRPVLTPGLLLSTVGVLITAGIVALAARPILGFTLAEGLLLGAIVASTDAAAVFSVLRARAVGLKRGLSPLLELESGSNDPMAIILTIGMIRVLQEPNTPIEALLLLFVQQMAVGALVGLASGRALYVVINRLRLEYDGLYTVLTISFVLLIYSATATLGGNGFLAVYLAGVVLGARDFIHKKSLNNFHDSLAWLMQIIMFLVLGLLVFPSQLPAVAPEGLLLSAVLIFIARPVSVFVSLLFVRLGLREKLMLSWVGLRGAAPIILATFPLLAGLPKANLIFNLVFFVVLTSVLLQGTTISPMARFLRVTTPLRPRRQYPIEHVPGTTIKNELVEFEISDSSPVVGQQIVELGLPRGSLIVLIARDQEFVIPTGSTVIEAGDHLLILAETRALEETRALLRERTLEEP